MQGKTSQIPYKSLDEPYDLRKDRLDTKLSAAPAMQKELLGHEDSWLYNLSYKAMHKLRILGHLAHSSCTFKTATSLIATL